MCLILLYPTFVWSTGFDNADHLVGTVYHTLRAGDVFSCLNWRMLGQMVRS